LVKLPRASSSRKQSAGFQPAGARASSPHARVFQRRLEAGGPAAWKAALRLCDETLGNKRAERARGLIDF
jgi:hypothetical protein